MKKICLLLLVVFFALTANAQEILSGSLDCLKGRTKAALVIDYSNASILGMSEGEYAKYETRWELCKKEARLLFISNFAEKHDGVLFVGEEEADYTLQVNVLSINRKGYCKAELHIKDAKTHESKAVIATFHSSISPIGTTNRKVKANIGVIGGKVGDYLNNNFK